MSATEHALKRKVDEYLKLQQAGGDTWYMKVHGGRYQRAGVPDFIGCTLGLFFSIELKRDEQSTPRPRQEVEIRKIRRAGGMAFVCWSVEGVREAIEQVRAAA